jgi:hypothetical protein
MLAGVVASTPPGDGDLLAHAHRASPHCWSPRAAKGGTTVSFCFFFHLPKHLQHATFTVTTFEAHIVSIHHNCTCELAMALHRREREEEQSTHTTCLSSVNQHEKTQKIQHTQTHKRMLLRCSFGEVFSPRPPCSAWPPGGSGRWRILGRGPGHQRRVRLWQNRARVLKKRSRIG